MIVQHKSIYNHILLQCIVCMLISVHQFCSAYEVTPATVEVFYPKGFQVSIPGIFILHCVFYQNT